MDISTLSVTELKALCFDEISKIELSQGNLRALQAEIVKRQKEGEKVDPETPKE